MLCCFVHTCFGHLRSFKILSLLRMSFGHLRSSKLSGSTCDCLLSLPLVSLNPRMNDRCSDQDQANCADESVITPTAFHSLDAHR